MEPNLQNTNPAQQPVQPVSQVIQPQPQSQQPINNSEAVKPVQSQNYSVSQGEHHTGKSFLKILKSSAHQKTFLKLITVYY